jgi:hypothetical protein
VVYAAIALENPECDFRSLLFPQGKLLRCTYLKGLGLDSAIVPPVI